MIYGKVGYDAYAKSTGGKTFDGRDMPKWEDLPEPIRKAWWHAAMSILEECERPGDSAGDE